MNIHTDTNHRYTPPTPSSTHLLSPLSSHPPSPSLSPFPSLSPSPSNSSSTSSLSRLAREEDKRIPHDEVYSVDILEEVDGKLPNAASALPESLPTPPRCREGDAPVVRVRGMLCPPRTSPNYSVGEEGRDPFEGCTSSLSSDSLGSGSMDGESVFGDGGEIGRGEGVDGEGDGKSEGGVRGMLDVDVDIGVEFLEVEKEWGVSMDGIKDGGGESEGESESQSESESELVERRALVAM